MANRNICDVEMLGLMSENTNVIVEENGVLNKLNLNDTIANTKDEIETKMTKSYIKGYVAPTTTCAIEYATLPLTKYDNNGNAFDVINGKIHILKNCAVSIMSSVYLYEGFTAGDVVSAHVTVSGNGSAELCRSTVRPYYANPYHFLSFHTIHGLSAGDIISLEAKNQTGARGQIMGGWMNTFVAIHEL